MKITVDTNKDSQEEIKKAINLLNTFLAEKGAMTDSKPEAAPITNVPNEADVSKMLDEIKKNDPPNKDDEDIEDLSSLKIVEY